MVKKDPEIGAEGQKTVSKIHPTLPEGPGWYLEVDAASDGLRLDRFISNRVQRLSRARAARLDAIDLDAPERALRKSATLRSGQRIWVHRPVPDQVPDGPRPKILFQGDGLLVIDKPPNLAIHPSASRYLSTVTHWLHQEGLDHFHPAHRLDVETSGILVCGDADHLKMLSDCFAQRSVQKTYLAVVDGRPQQEEWTARQPLGFDESSGIRLKMGHGRLPAETHFRVREHGLHRSIVEAKPVTGRQHQIRIHAQMSGHALVGDKLYGPNDALFFASKERDLTSDEWRILGHHRHALHAAQIHLQLPHQSYSFECPLPEELRGLIQGSTIGALT